MLTIVMCMNIMFQTLADTWCPLQSLGKLNSLAMQGIALVSEVIKQCHVVIVCSNSSIVLKVFLEVPFGGCFAEK